MKTLIFATMLVCLVGACNEQPVVGYTTKMEVRSPRVAADVLAAEPVSAPMKETAAAIRKADGNWGTVKGAIVWAGDKLPVVGNVDVTKEKEVCLAKGAIKRDDLIVDAKSKTVANVMIYLATADGSPVPIHPSLQAVPKDVAVIDQPCCMFEPRITLIRAGQPLEIRNSAEIAHNTRIVGRSDGLNGTKNVNIPPKGKLVFEGEKAFKAEKKPMPIQCDIHGWMGGVLGVFDHPYFAVTKADGSFEFKNAPAGKYQLFIYHEKAGWLHNPRSSKGQPIEIPAGGTLDLGKIEFKPDYLDP